MNTAVQSAEQSSDLNESLYNDGTALEKEFAEFMRKELKWKKTSMRRYISGKTNPRGWEIDIIAERLNVIGVQFLRAAKTILITGAAFLAISVIIGITIGWQGLIEKMLILTGIILAAESILFVLISARFSHENAIVECKDLKGKVSSRQLILSTSQLSDYKKSGNKRYKFVKHYFVSVNGFTQPALQFAEVHQITCYRKKDGKFMITPSWDE